jgi:antitoxin VapB
MGISIKNREVEKLIKTITRETGEGITEAVRIALQERYDKIKRAKQGPGLYHEILSISKRCGRLPTLDHRSPDEILGYNEHGWL